jgi:hypothetical protein
VPDQWSARAGAGTSGPAGARVPEEGEVAAQKQSAVDKSSGARKEVYIVEEVFVALDEEGSRIPIIGCWTPVPQTICQGVERHSPASTVALWAPSSSPMARWWSSRE